MAVEYSTTPSPEFLNEIFGLGETTPTPSPEPATTEAPEATTQPEIVDMDAIMGVDEETPAATITKEKPDTHPSTETIEEETPELTDEDYTKQIFKHTAKKLIDSKLFADVEGFEEMEFDESTFAEFVEAQVQFKTEEQWERVKSSNEVVNGILSAIEAGVPEDKILDLFKEQKAITSIDTSSAAGKLEYIEQYYKLLEWDDRKISRELKRIDAEGEDALQEEFEFAQEKTGKHFQQEQQRMIEQQKAEEEAQAARTRARAQGAYKTLTEGGIKEQKAQQLLQNAFKSYKLPSGDLVDGYEVALMQVKNDPAKYAEMVRFLFDKENYIKEIQTKEANKVVDKTFQKLTFKQPTKANSAGIPQPTTSKSKAADPMKEFVDTLFGTKK